MSILGKDREVKTPRYSRSKVTFFKAKEVFAHSDPRRMISGMVGNFQLPFTFVQIKLITFSEKAVTQKMAVGNHSHDKQSGQWEMALILGSGKKSTFRFRFKDHSGGIKEKKLRPGDVVVVPPGCALAFVALEAGAAMLEMSNQEYNQNYEKHFLFKNDPRP